MSDNHRDEIQRKWTSERVQIICATVAFGMGIDKPNVRFVFHYSMPQSLEGYYQESGRAGRDGQKALCVLYYNYNDMNRYRKIKQKKRSYDCSQIDMDKLWKMVDYCENVSDCRRVIQLNYFGENFSREQCLAIQQTMCDNCVRRDCYEILDVTDECKKIANAVKDLCIGSNNRFTISHMVSVLKGGSNEKIFASGHNNSLHYGQLRTWKTNDIERLFHRMVIDQYLREDIIFHKDIPNMYVKIGRNFDKLKKAVSIKFASQIQALLHRNEDSESESSSDAEDTFAAILNRKWIYSSDGRSQTLTDKEDWQSSSSSDEDQINSSLPKRKHAAENIAQSVKKRKARQ